MKTMETINPAILDVYGMTQQFGADIADKMFAGVNKSTSDLVLQGSSTEEFKEFNYKIYAKSSVDRIAERIQESTMLFKIEEVVNYGKEDFVGKRFYQLRRFGDNYIFNEFSVSTCVHARGFIPAVISRTSEDEYKVRFLKNAFGEGKRIAKSNEGRDYIKTTNRFSIFTDM